MDQLGKKFGRKRFLVKKTSPSGLTTNQVLYENHNKSNHD